MICIYQLDVLMYISKVATNQRKKYRERALLWQKKSRREKKAVKGETGHRTGILTA